MKLSITAKQFREAEEDDKRRKAKQKRRVNMLAFTDEHLSALKRFAKHNGRNWRAALRKAWEKGDYVDMTAKDIYLLHRLRNIIGPLGLAKVKL